MEPSVRDQRAGQTGHCPVCELCGSIEKLSLCSACRGTWYCCKDHQKKHWKSHKRLCRESGRRTGKKSVTAASSGSGGVVADTDTDGCSRGTLSTQSSASLGSSTFHDSPRNEEKRVTAGRIKEGGENAAALAVTPCTDDDVSCASGTSEDARRPVDASHVRGGEGPPTQTLHTYHKNNEVNASCGDLEVATNKDMCENKNLQSDNPLLDEDDGPGRVVFTCQPEEEEDDEPVTSVYEESTTEQFSPNLAKRGRCSEDSLIQKSLSQSSSSGSSFGSFSSSGYYSSDSNTDLKLHNYSRLPSSAADSPLSSLPHTQAMVKPPESARPRKKRSAPKSSSMAPNIPAQPTGKEETKLSDYVTKCLTNYGICVVDRFCGEIKGSGLLEEVQYLEMSERLTKGQISTSTSQNIAPEIRGDRICWIEKGDPQCPNIGLLIHRLDTLMQSCNGRLGNHEINGRTKAMVACYPGDGTGYMRHVDNPNNDGRCVTCIYYLNRDWQVTKDGGLLRIFPSQLPSTSVADIEPGFDRLLLFWSDRRNPHEVQPAFRKRFAITVWYFDAEERSRAKHRHKIQNLVSQEWMRGGELSTQPGGPDGGVC